MSSALYYVLTDTLPWAAVSDFVHDDDRFYIEKFQVETDRRDRVVARRLLRWLARDIVGADFRIEILEHGKPHIEGMQFSISHCDGCIAFGHHNVALGVDVEHRDRSSDFKSISSRFFTPQECDIIGDDRALFFRFWTRKEAVLKATGKGLKTPLNAVDVINDETEIENASFSIDTIEIDRGFVFSWASTEPLIGRPKQLLPDGSLTDWTVLQQ